MRGAHLVPQNATELCPDPWVLSAYIHMSNDSPRIKVVENGRGGIECT